MNARIKIRKDGVSQEVSANKIRQPYYFAMPFIADNTEKDYIFFNKSAGGDAAYSVFETNWPCNTDALSDGYFYSIDRIGFDVATRDGSPVTATAMNNIRRAQVTVKIGDRKIYETTLRTFFKSAATYVPSNGVVGMGDQFSGPSWQKLGYSEALAPNQKFSFVVHMPAKIGQAVDVIAFLDGPLSIVQ
jgi:hypothetical protein